MYKKIKRVPFYYVRHGQTDWNFENRLMGQKDIPLNIQGINQAISARNSLIGAGITVICHSPLIRAKMTAEIFNEALNCRLFVIEELREFNLGHYEGKVKEQWLQDWQLGMHIPEAETYTDFIKRCAVGINKALSLPGLVLIVAHGGVYRAVAEALEISIEDVLENCVPVFHEPLKNEDKKWKSSKLRDVL